MDLPFRRIQEQKILLRNKPLTIQDALLLKVIGVDVFSFKYQFDAMNMLLNLENLTLSDILDLLVILHPGDLMDLSIIYQCVPRNFGHIGNEAYTGEDLLEKWISVFGPFDFDLSGNVLTNLYIRARFFSEKDVFFPDCQQPFYGNVLCNPPYPVGDFLDTLFTKICEKRDDIENMLIILPFNLAGSLQGILLRIRTNFSDYFHTLRVQTSFHKYEVVKRRATHTHFSINYFGKNKQVFVKEFRNYVELTDDNVMELIN
jgi:hypothetical protein